MREVKHLQGLLQEESRKVEELYIEAAMVRDELLGELQALPPRRAARKKGRRQRQVETLVSKAVSRAESLLSLSGEGISQKIEELIEEKSRSIVNVITQSQLTQYLASPAAYTVPVLQGQAPTQTGTRELGGYRHQQQVIEMSINESDEERPSSEEGEEEKFPSTRIEKVSEDSGPHQEQLIQDRSELSVLKTKLLEMRERHQSGLLAEEVRGR